MKSQINGVKIFPFPVITDGRGAVWKLPPAPFDVKDVYVTTVRKEAVKAWHGYTTKRLFWTVVKGVVRLGLMDDRPGSPTELVQDTLYLGEGANISVEVPPGVWNGFKGVADGESIIVVQASEPYDPERVLRLAAHGAISYDWSRHDG